MESNFLGRKVDFDVGSDRVEFCNEFLRAWREEGFVAVRNYNYELTGLRNNVYSLFREFCNLPLDVKMKYYDPKVGGQRSYIPNDVGSSSGGKYTDCREHLMIGPRIPNGCPLARCRPYFYLPNKNIEEVPGLVECSENLLE